MSPRRSSLIAAAARLAVVLLVASTCVATVTVAGAEVTAALSTSPQVATASSLPKLTQVSSCALIRCLSGYRCVDGRCLPNPPVWVDGPAVVHPADRVTVTNVTPQLPAGGGVVIRQGGRRLFGVDAASIATSPAVSSTLTPPLKFNRCLIIRCPAGFRCNPDTGKCQPLFIDPPVLIEQPILIDPLGPIATPVGDPTLGGGVRAEKQLSVNPIISASAPSTITAAPNLPILKLRCAIVPCPIGWRCDPATGHCKPLITVPPPIVDGPAPVLPGDPVQLPGGGVRVEKPMGLTVSQTTTPVASSTPIVAVSRCALVLCAPGYRCNAETGKCQRMVVVGPIVDGPGFVHPGDPVQVVIQPGQIATAQP